MMMSESGENYPKKAVVVHHHHHHHEVETTTGNGQGGGMMDGESQCSGREKTLTLCAIILAVLAFALLTFIAVSGPLSTLLSSRWNTDLGFVGVCDSKDCVEISYRAIQAGNFGADPCDDFYYFACSKWQLHNPITTDQFFHAANINMIKDQVDLKIKKLLENEDSSRIVDSDPGRYKIEENVKAFYQSCLNFVHPDENLLIAELLSSVGGYQWSETWSDSQFDLTNTTLKFLRLNAASLFDVMLDIDAKNRSRFALIIDLPRPTTLTPNLFHGSTSPDQDFLYQMETLYQHQKVHGGDSDPSNFKFSNTNHVNFTNGMAIVDRQFLYKMITDNVEAKKMSQLKSLVRKVCYMMNVSEEECNADINDIAFIVTTIQKFLPSQRTRKFWKQQNLVYNKYNIDTLEGQFGAIDWKWLLGCLVRGNSADEYNLDREAVNWKEMAGTVYVPYPDYLRRLFTYLQFVNKRVLYNSMLMVYVRDMLNDLVDKGKIEVTSSSSSKSTISSPTAKPGELGDEPRWKFCVHSTKSVFAMELSSFYLRSFDPGYLQQVRIEVEDIFRNVKESLKNFLNRSTWLEKNSRLNALRKIRTLKGNFLAPSFYFRDDFVDESIKNIQIDPGDFLGNVRLVYRTFREQLYRLFRSHVDEERVTWAFVTFPFVVNAFYIQQFNSIVIPLAFLTSPHYTWGAPKYINYATIALTIAHEALHSLDGSGSDFDADGKLLEWLSDSRGFLREKSMCVAKQYSDNFRKLIPFYQTHVPIQVDGNLTQNENMADIAGLQVAFSAYKRYRESLMGAEVREAELKLPGLNYTLEQIFFIAVAQAYCANISPMGYVVLLEVDEHTPHPERVNGMLMNIPEFSKTWNCPVGSPMNPELKCSLW